MDKINNKKRVIVFLPSSLIDAFEVVLARACDLKDLGFEVIVSFCKGKIRGCPSNPHGLSSLCSFCEKNTKKALSKTLPSACIETSELVQTKNKISIETQQPKNLAARSTILTFYRKDTDRLNSNYINNLYIKKIFKKFIKYEISTYVYTKRLIEKLKPDRVEIYNGRITPSMSIMNAAKDSGIEFYLIDQLGYYKNIFISKNIEMHAIDNFKEEIRNFNPSLEDFTNGIDFFKKKRSGVSTDARSFTNRHIIGLFKKTNKKFIAIFLSSNDEVEAYGDNWFTNASKDPVKFIISLRGYLSELYQIIVRMHPNQSGDKTGSTQKIINELKNLQGIDVIQPNEKNSSYELIDLASVVITFGSTIGVEATYWGKTCILAGRAIWEDEKIAYYVDSSNEAFNLIISNPHALDKIGAVKVAAYIMKYRKTSVNLEYNRVDQLFYLKGLNFSSKRRGNLSFRLNQIIENFFS